MVDNSKEARSDVALLECTVCIRTSVCMYYVHPLWRSSPVHMGIAIMNPSAPGDSVFGLMHKRYVLCLLWVCLRFGILDASSFLGGSGVSSGQGSRLNGN